VSRSSRRAKRPTRPNITHNGYGGYAEYVIAKETEAALKPKSIDHVYAATIPVAAVTAWRALFDTAGLRKGQKVPENSQLANQRCAEWVWRGTTFEWERGAEPDMAAWDECVKASRCISWG
jgi:hypothetical protein